MLVISRERDQALLLRYQPPGETPPLEVVIRVVLLDLERGRARIGIEAPREVVILREEIASGPPRKDG